MSAAKPKHIAELAARSQRVDIRPDPPSLIVALPDSHSFLQSVNEIVRVDVDRRSVEFTLIDRNTARLTAFPPAGLVVGLFWVYPADYCSRLMEHLQEAETPDELHEIQSPTLVDAGRSHHPSDTGYGFQSRNYRRT